MTKLLERAGASFLRAFGVGLVVYGAGVLAAPNLDNAYTLGIAALAASFTAGFRALQEFIPALTFKPLLGDVAGAYVDSFARAFFGSLIALTISWLNAPDLSFSRSAFTGIVYGAGAAGFRALQGLFTKGEYPFPNKGK